MVNWWLRFAILFEGVKKVCRNQKILLDGEMADLVEGAGICESLGLPRGAIFAVFLRVLQKPWFFIKEELLCVVCEAVVEHLVLHSENILHFN